MIRSVEESNLRLLSVTLRNDYMVMARSRAPIHRNPSANSIRGSKIGQGSLF